MAGVTVAAYLVPQVMAYATVAGLPPVTGLWAAVPALSGYALLGSSTSLSIGPEATTALMTASRSGRWPPAIRPGTRSSPLACPDGRGIALVAGLLRLGFVADLLSRPVLVGYMAGVALIMIADQLDHVTGVPVTGQTFFAQLSSFARKLGQVQPTLAVALPDSRFSCCAMALAAIRARCWQYSSRPRSWPQPTRARRRHDRPDPGRAADARSCPTCTATLHELLLPAFAVLIVGFTDDVLTARSFATSDTVIVANRELLALGVANAGSSLFHGFPVSSSGSRTAIARTSGTGAGLLTDRRRRRARAACCAAHSLSPPDRSARRHRDLCGRAPDRRHRVPALLSFRRMELAIAVAACAGVLPQHPVRGADRCRAVGRRPASARCPPA